MFFVYSVSPRVNTTIRLCRILNILTQFVGSDQISSESKHFTFKNMYDSIHLVLKKNASNGHTQVETLYLLIALSELGKQYWLKQDVLASSVGICRDKNNDEFHSNYELNYFSITVLLFYMKDKVRYSKLRTFIEEEIKKKFIAKSVTLRRDAELTFLSFDLLSCPYVSPALKDTILCTYGIADTHMQNQVLIFQNKSKERQLWFTTWENFDFGKELDAKQSQEVY